jgi:hypothetical protein
MTETTFFNAVTNGKTDLIQRLLDMLNKENIHYCVIGGLAVNAYAEPVVSLDLDIVILSTDRKKLLQSAAAIFEIKEFPHSTNLYHPQSDVRIQIQNDERYNAFPGRAELKKVLGYEMNIASLEDVFQGKVWAYQDAGRRKSKRQKDLADIFRLVENYPALERLLPEEIKNRGE